MDTKTSALKLNAKLSKVSLRKTLAIAAEADQDCAILSSLIEAIAITEDVLEECDRDQKINPAALLQQDVIATPVYTDLQAKASHESTPVYNYPCGDRSYGFPH